MALAAGTILSVQPTSFSNSRFFTAPRPIPNSYWATPFLLACEFPWDPREQYNPKIDALLKAGVRTFIDLTERGELQAYDHVLGMRAVLLGIDPSTIEYHCFPIRDRCLPASPQLVQQIMCVLEDNERRTRLGAIHCRGGVGRTGTLVGCWLVHSHIARDGQEALAIVDTLWKTVPKSKRYSQSPETGAQYDFVLKFKPMNSNTLLPVAWTTYPFQILTSYLARSLLYFLYVVFWISLLRYLFLSSVFLPPFFTG